MEEGMKGARKEKKLVLRIYSPTDALAHPVITVTAQLWNRPSCLLIDERTKTAKHLHIREFSSTTKKKIVLFVGR